MTHNNALITNAMLALYASEKNITYLQMIEPFIIYSIPNKVNKKIDIAKVAQKVYTEFGLDIKSKVVERVLLNLSKVKKNRQITSEKVKNKFYFYLKVHLDTTDFDIKRQTMKNFVADVVILLRDFINEENVIKKISTKQAETMLINYLNEYNILTYKSIENVKIIQEQEKITSENYKVAKFIWREYENELGCFDKIKIIQEGYFASIALYNFFETIDKNNENKQNIIKGHSIILDTMLLIDALQLDTEYKAKSMEELLILIHDNGGILYTFDYYVNELCGIIEKYVNDPDKRITLDLDYFRRNNSNIAQILLLENKLETACKALDKISLSYHNIEIKILDSAFYDTLTDKGNWHINQINLEKAIKQEIKYQNFISFENDCKTIGRILYEKKSNQKDIIFLSSNNRLISVAKHFTEAKYRNAFYTDMDLTAMIWLSNYNSKSKLSECALLQNAYAALSPEKEILHEVIDMIDQNMNSTDEQLKTDALTLRYNNDLLKYISQVYQNDKNNLKLKTQEDLMLNLRKNIAAEMQAETKAEVEKDYRNKNKRIKEQEYKTNQQIKKIKEKEKIIQKRERDLKVMENDLHTIEHHNKLLDDELDATKTLLKKLTDSTRNRNKNIAMTAAKLCNLALFFVFGVALYFIIKPWVYFCFLNMIKNDIENNIYQISNLCAFLITVITCGSMYIGLQKKIVRKIEEYIYHFLCKHSIILNQGM